MLGILLVLGLTATVIADPPDDMTINQAIQEAATSSKNMDFIQDNSTLMIELDMLMTKDHWDAYQGHGNGRQKRKGIRGQRWTNNIVPYERIPFGGRDRNTIMQAFEDYHRYTCIQFQPDNGRSYNKIYFTDGGGCSSYVGMSGNRQPVTLAQGCRTKGIVIHELGHAVGLHHEQTRPDRDNYVTINFNNIHSNMAYNFKKNDVDDLGVPYSYLSVMHYDQYSFSSNGRVTIIARQSQYQNTMGNRPGFDFADIKILNLMYNCAGHCPRKSCPRDGFLGKDCQCWCPGSPYTVCSGGGGGGGGGSVIGGGGGGSTGGGGGGGSCYDSNKDCDYWRQQGHCNSRKYGYYMRNNCKRSCGLCNGSYSRKGDCMDQLTKCEQWAEQGECKSNPAYMSQVCAKSCNACSRSFSRRSCRDANPSCEAWAKKGMCEENKEYMNDTCGKSCNPECKGK